MKTDDLISMLAEDAPVRSNLGRSLNYALVIGVVMSAALLVATIGIRHDMANAIETARVLCKILVTLVLALTACHLVFRIGRPGVPLKLSGCALAIAPVLLAVAVLTELIVVPSDAWAASMIGRNARFCLMFIPLLSLAPLGGFLWALRHGAPERPGLAGATAGLAAGAIAAAIYAWHCPDDSPLFVAVWYTTAISAVTAIGALVGSKILRW
jgi:hypothetical protein